MDRISGFGPGGRRNDRGPQALSGARGLLDRSPPASGRLSLRLGVAERAGGRRRSPGDRRLQLLLSPSALHVHDPGPPQRRGSLRVPGVRPAHRAAVRAFTPQAAAHRGGTPRPHRADAALPGVPLRHEPRDAAGGRRRPASPGPRLRAGRHPPRRCERQPLPADRNGGDRLPRGHRGSRLPPGQFGGLSVRARRHRHLPPHPRGGCNARVSSSPAASARASAWPRPARS